MVKLGALRAPSLTQLRGRDTHALYGPCLRWSRVGTHRSGTQYPRDALFKGRNIHELSVRDTSVGDTSTLHRVNNTGGKFAASVNNAGGNDAGGKLPPVSTTPAANVPPVVLTPVANNGKNIRLQTPESELEG